MQKIACSTWYSLLLMVVSINEHFIYRKVQTFCVEMTFTSFAASWSKFSTVPFLSTYKVRSFCKCTTRNLMIRKTVKVLWDMHAYSIPYSGKLLKEKTFENFAVLWLYAKVFFAKFGAWRPLALQKRAIRESFLCKNHIFTNSRRFPAIWYMIVVPVILVHIVKVLWYSCMYTWCTLGIRMFIMCLTLSTWNVRSDEIVKHGRDNAILSSTYPVHGSVS